MEHKTGILNQIPKTGFPDAVLNQIFKPISDKARIAEKKYIYIKIHKNCNDLRLKGKMGDLETRGRSLVVRTPSS